ncbi:hypothetical protein [Mucilaginibacter dorajii]|uniref:Uncharacterized protein n=1 Tax=Mucilaginibacter dorajii TaxID=692994 RepID=A0ABP7P2I6_9SPHI|nr:hypothetical protein [Mucilaginibacter dorajii]MCS3737008.1 hypothetical protein [Mucilaginibacter dorajii]
MTKQKLLLLFIAVCAIWNSAKGQSYSVESFEGQTVKINLTEKPTKKTWYSATVSCLTDSLFLVDYNGIKEVHVLGHKFLEIVYDTRGGSGYQSRNTVILSVKENKMHVAILVNSFGKAFGSDIDGSIYVVKFNIIGNNKSNFKLVAHIYDRHNSSSYPSKNYVRNKKVILNFDSVRNVFYSAHKRITQSFTIDDPKTQQSGKQKISGTLPIIALVPDNYYYINGEWYKRGYDDNLFKEYYR